MKTVVLGNANPKAYRNNPRAPDGLSVAQLEAFATDVCKLDISGVLEVGDWMRGPATMEEPEGAKVYEITAQHRAALLRELIERPVEMPWVGGKCRTKINVSPDSSFSQALSEINRIVTAHFNGPIGWVAGTDAALVEAVRQEFGIEEVREYDPALVDVPPKGAAS